MPRGDRTGPMGMGPMTGRAAGYCAGFDTPGFQNPVPGRGFGMGFGRGRGARGRGCGFGGGGGGRGWRNMFYATGQPGWMRSGVHAQPAGYPQAAYSNADPESEKQILLRQAEALQAELDQIRKRLDALETKPATE